MTLPPPNIDDLRVVSLKKAADLMDVCAATVTNMLRAGELRGTKVRGLIRVYVWSIDAYQKKNMIVPLKESAPEPARRKVSSSAEHRAAVKELESLGIISRV